MASKRKLTLMRQAQTTATQRWSIGGLIKRKPPKPVSVATGKRQKQHATR